MNWVELTSEEGKTLWVNFSLVSVMESTTPYRTRLHFDYQADSWINVRETPNDILRSLPEPK